MTDEITQALVDALRMLSKRPIATWYSNGQGNGYYAGWDDAEFIVKQTLAKYESTQPTEGKWAKKHQPKWALGKQ